MVNNKQGMNGAFKLLQVQLLVMFVLSAFVFIATGMHAASSIVLGGLVSALPNAYFAKVLFRYHGALVAQKIVRSFYKGEAIKLLLTFSLFALIFKMINVVPMAFMIGFIAAQMVFWFAPFIFDNKR